MKPKIAYFKKLDNIYEGALVGEIYRAENNLNKGNIQDHYFMVYGLDDPSQLTFKGIMLTSSSKLEYNNIKVPQNYFKLSSENGNKYEFPTNPTLLTQHKRIKYNEWAPFYQVGELTDEGLAFIKNIVDKLDATEFEFNKK